MAEVTARAPLPWWAEYGFDAPQPAIAALERALRLAYGNADAMDDWLTDARACGVPAEVLDTVCQTVSTSRGLEPRGGAAWPR